MIDVLPHRSAVSLHSSKRSSLANSRAAVQSRASSCLTVGIAMRFLSQAPLPFLRQATGPHSTMSDFGGKADIGFTQLNVRY